MKCPRRGKCRMAKSVRGLLLCCKDFVVLRALLPHQCFLRESFPQISDALIYGALLLQNAVS